MRVLDDFHVTRLGFAAVDDVCRGLQQDSLGHRGHRDDPLFRIRRPADRAHLDRRLRPPHDLRLPDSLRRRAAPAPLAHPLRRHERPRATPPGPHHRRLAARGARLLRHRRRLQRTHRGHELTDQEGQARRTRVPQLRQLPAAATAALRRGLADSPTSTNQRPATTLGCVEPCFGQAARLLARSNERNRSR